MSWVVQVTAFTVLGQVHWTATAMRTTDATREWRQLGQGMEPLGDLADDPRDVAWLAAQCLQEELVGRGSPWEDDRLTGAAEKRAGRTRS